ncbi:sensor histidine kinase, partial [Rhizobium johnstonii]
SRSAEAPVRCRYCGSPSSLRQIEKSSITEIVTRVVDVHQHKTESHVETVIDEDGPELPHAVKICIYRFVQEALNNAY